MLQTLGWGHSQIRMWHFRRMRHLSIATFGYLDRLSPHTHTKTKRTRILGGPNNKTKRIIRILPQSLALSENEHETQSPGERSRGWLSTSSIRRGTQRKGATIHTLSKLVRKENSNEHDWTSIFGFWLSGLLATVFGQKLNCLIAQEPNSLIA